MKKICYIFFPLLILLNTTLLAQGNKMPPASSSQVLIQDFALSQIKISYSRPNVKGRTIYGGLVPFGAVWRTGANSPTKISFSADVLFEGQTVPAGEYALYTIPGEKEWIIILSKNTKLWGANGYNETEDLLRVKVSPTSLAQKTETFTIEIGNVQANSCELHINWDKTGVPIKIGANTVK